MNDYRVEIKGEELLLSPQRAVYWPAQKVLIVSDLHLGKAGHFRKHGIAVSKKVHLHDLAILTQLLHHYKPKTLLFLGDLFHSEVNNEWVDFLRFLNQHKEVDFLLVEGNHDILNDYPSHLCVVKKKSIGPFSFTHIKEEDHLFNFSGHIHPGISIRTRARQSLTLPCFLFSASFAIMPAFGQFTGIKKIRPSKKDRIFGITAEQVIEIPKKNE